LLPSVFPRAASIRPHHSPPPSSNCFRSRIHPSLIRRQAPTRGPLEQPLDLVARSASHGDDVLRDLNEGYVQQRSQPAARLDLGAGPVGVIRPGLLRAQPVVPRVDGPDRVLLVTPRRALSLIHLRKCGQPPRRRHRSEASKPGETSLPCCGPMGLARRKPI
jgi:hypothetical protein